MKKLIFIVFFVISLVAVGLYGCSKGQTGGGDRAVSPIDAIERL